MEKDADVKTPAGIAQLKGDVVAIYTFGRPDNRRRDVANLEKAIGDTLTRWGVLKDDCQIIDIRLLWGEVLPGSAKVELREAD
ncbi:RusA family crossover junction endodeoxyribonuclease [Rhizobium laguerreae]|uniref:RusA family crossover junction endodeoxyribonuclease n=1 Tax=Rhizobium laguerreae TaxID=1076926 RepID=UPI00197F82EA